MKCHYRLPFHCLSLYFSAQQLNQTVYFLQNSLFIFLGKFPSRFKDAETDVNTVKTLENSTMRNVFTRSFPLFFYNIVLNRNHSDGVVLWNSTEEFCCEIVGPVTTYFQGPIREAYFILNLLPIYSRLSCAQLENCKFKKQKYTHSISLSCKTNGLNSQQEFCYSMDALIYINKIRLCFDSCERIKFVDMHKISKSIHFQFVMQPYLLSF